MALTIQGADIGYDANEVQTALNNVHAQVIEEAKSQLRQQLAQLDTSVDEIWVGQSAETFKKNMQTDVDSICEALDKIYDFVKASFTQITSGMASIDENLIQERSE